MKNYFVVISIMIIFLIPLNVSALTDETFQEWLMGTEGSAYQECTAEAASGIQVDCGLELTNIEHENQPHASAYVTLRNSNGDLVGVTHITASYYLEHPIFYAFINEQPLIENVTIEGMQYEMRVMPLELYNHPDFCLAQQGMGQENIHDTCFFYTFTTKLDTSFVVKNQKHTITAFSALHHGFLTEGGDRINVNWTALIPIN